MPITALPPAPQPTDDTATFNAKAFALLAALATLVAEANTVESAVDADAAAASSANSNAQSAKTAAEVARDAAAASASAAAASAGAALWVSGTTYALGAVVWSPANGLIYRRKVAGAGATDPSADATNWLLSGGPLQLVVVTASTHAAALNSRVVLRGALVQTVTAPAAPQPGDRWAIKVANGRLDAVIDWNGAKHELLSDSTTTCDRAGWAAEFVYIDATYGWGIV